jgi:hypothetical protein
VSDVNTQKCDECGILKREVNNWYHAVTIRGYFCVADKALSLDDEYSAIEYSEGAKRLDLCSESCAVKAMSKAIGRQSE